jgi:hypothetical protein
MFLKFNSILLRTKKIIDEALEHRANMQTTKKGKQLFKNVKNFAVLQ